MCIFFMMGTTRSAGMFLTELQSTFDVTTFHASLLLGGYSLGFAVAGKTLTLVQCHVGLKVVYRNLNIHGSVSLYVYTYIVNAVLAIYIYACVLVTFIFYIEYRL